MDRLEGMKVVSGGVLVIESMGYFGETGQGIVGVVDITGVSWRESSELLQSRILYNSDYRKVQIMLLISYWYVLRLILWVMATILNKDGKFSILEVVRVFSMEHFFIYMSLCVYMHV